MTKNLLLRSRLLILSMALAAGVISCKNEKQEEQQAESELANAQENSEELFFDISLAQWSLSKPILEGELDPMDFAEKASEMGFDGIEYVSQLYTPLYKDSANPKEALQTVLDTLKARSEQYGVENVLIMVDNEGDLASNSEEERNEAVENHKKWVDAAEYLGAHSIRVNLFGSEVPEEWQTNAVDGLSKLGEYAAGKDINVLVENHGYLSSNAQLLVEVMEQANMENVGTLPDFGNFCLKREGGERWEAECVEEYPKYQGVEEMMEYAKAVSAKSYDFNEAGDETTIDFKRMLEIVKDAGYSGYIGIEYEGPRLSPEEGILATKNLLVKAGQELSNQ
ncbi:sugar phosphate isomerase/epimerase family protein [Salinimicrobium sp. GXAS 041]|uniref:sugar phosphate isomerase/epimerase family protein n=1 Tax=Salinimicrobium sp. GXAS 041 TaxID=3400806 RepID=UPI003C76A146